jgi:N-acetylmuramic acid 6-phosphate (MurNAc-6-P) etherase
MINSLRKSFRTVSAFCVTCVLYAGGNMSVLITPLDARTKAADQSTQTLREDPYLAALSIGFMPFEEFEKEFALGNTSTEQLHPITKHLSQVTHNSIPKGMELLLKVDESVVKGLEAFIPSITTFAPFIAEKVSQGGRVFLVGSGSSGRVAIDIAAKCGTKFLKVKEQIQGIIAGGDSALIRAKEGFEDSEADGEAALKDANLGPKDTVILISASGSASFNVGCGHFSANKGASVFYFYNSKNVPLRTQRLFERNVNPVIPLCLDIGPQAIGGSTRLQGATLAEGCLGALLGSTIYLTQGEKLLSKEYPKELALKMQKGLELIKNNLKLIQQFPQLEVQVFSSPHSNFRQLSDISNQGYVTVIALEDSMREVLIDSTETSPTFSTNPIRRESERHKKRAEFQAYMIGQGDNSKAWTSLLGRDVHTIDIKDAETFLLASEEDGVNSFSKRPIGVGNFLIGVAKINESEPIPHQLIQVLEAAKKQGGSVGLLVVCRGKLSEVQVKALRDAYDCTLIVENTPSDAIGFTETIVLKQILNLISNSSMVLMNKVHGNQMIDVRASNKKLIDRCIRLIKDIWIEYQPNQPLNDKLLYHYVAHVSAIKKSYEEKGIYTPSVVKIVLSMLALKKTPDNFQNVIEYLAEKQERIDWIGGDQ